MSCMYLGNLEPGICLALIIYIVGAGVAQSV
jgi:hypothetical protein